MINITRPLRSHWLLTAAFCIGFAALTATAIAQDQLAPETGVLGEAPDEYRMKLRYVFADAYTSDVVLRVVILESFEPEEVVGVRKTDTGYEVFRMLPSSTVWDTEVVRLFGAVAADELSKEGGGRAPDQSEPFQGLKQRTPSDYHSITARTQRAGIAAPIAERIANVWQTMLLDARHPKDPLFCVDGTSYHFSMEISMRGVVSAQTHSPAEDTRAWKLTQLAHGLSRYAGGKTDTQGVCELLNALEPAHE